MVLTSRHSLMCQSTKVVWTQTHTAKSRLITVLALWDLQRAVLNDQWWLLVSGINNELLTGANFTQSGTFVARAGVRPQPVGNHYAGYGAPTRSIPLREFDQ